MKFNITANMEIDATLSAKDNGKNMSSDPPME